MFLSHATKQNVVLLLRNSFKRYAKAYIFLKDSMVYWSLSKRNLTAFVSTLSLTDKINNVTAWFFTFMNHEIIKILRIDYPLSGYLMLSFNLIFVD